MLYAYVPNFVSIGLFYRPLLAKTPILPFLESSFSGVANWQQSEKVEHECTTTNLPPIQRHPASKSFLYSNAFRRTNSGVQKRDGQTDRQADKKLKVFGRRSGG